MGILSGLFRQMKETMKVQALEEARNIPTMLNNIRMCRDEDLRERMAARISATMRALESSALAGDTQSTLLYSEMTRKYQSIFTEYNIRYKS